MRRNCFALRLHWQPALALAMLLLLTLSSGSVYAQGGFTLERMTIDGGGGDVSGGNFVVTGTVGQPDSGELEGGNFVLVGGFHLPQGLETTGEPDGFSLVMPLLFGSQ